MYQELRQSWEELTAEGAPFATHRVEVRGVPVLAYVGAPPSLRAVWMGAALHGDKDYLVFRDERWSYASAHRETASIANWLIAQGVRPGDRVAIAMRNYPEWMLVYWAGLSIGASIVGMNAWWTPAEMAFGLDDSDPKVIFCDEERLARVNEKREHAADRVVVAVRCDAGANDVDYATVRDHGGEMPDIEIDPDSEACIFYTSGTTGTPKGAQLTHRGCTNQMMTLAFAAMVQAKAAIMAGRPPANITGTGDGTAVQPAALVVTPLFHVTANNCVAHGMTALGGKLVHLYKWDAAEALLQVEREKVTTFSGVPTMVRELVSHPDYAKRDVSTLKAISGGGAAVQPDLVKKVESKGGGRPGTGYGMTETCGLACSVNGDFFVDRPESVGPAMPCFEVKCIDENGKEVPQGELGELCLRSSQIIAGYLNRPEATAEAIQDGWLRTGDIARVDEDGFIFLVDRAKDMVLRGGENVYCAEVENALFEHDSVGECQVFGVPDDRLGEEVGAAIYPKDGETIDPDALRAFCAERIAKYKVPRYIWVLDEPLPRGATGKTLKRELRDKLDTADAR